MAYDQKLADAEKEIERLTGRMTARAAIIGEQKAEIERLHRILEDRLNDLKIIGDNNEKLLRQVVELRQEIDRLKSSNEQ